VRVRQEFLYVTMAQKMILSSIPRYSLVHLAPYPLFSSGVVGAWLGRTLGVFLAPVLRPYYARATPELRP
jgi:hypothetical protein